MLIDFCSLLPELYDDRICTHNTHLLLHLAKYVKLWGPLWTHSSFGIENKNGCLKRLFHGKNKIHQQMLFGIDVCITLQLLYPILSSQEDSSVIEFIDQVNNNVSKSNMILMADHTYIVGASKTVTLNSKQCEAFHCNSEVTFTKLYKDGLIYRTRDKALRNDTVCVFKSEDNSVQFGLINIFIAGANPTALLYKSIILDDTILDQAGHPCRSVLLEYQEANLLGKYIIPVQYQRTSLTAIKFDAILGKAVIVDSGRSVYAVIQPNRLTSQFFDKIIINS